MLDLGPVDNIHKFAFLKQGLWVRVLLMKKIRLEEVILLKAT